MNLCHQGRAALLGLSLAISLMFRSAHAEIADPSTLDEMLSAHDHPALLQMLSEPITSDEEQLQNEEWLKRNLTELDARFAALLAYSISERDLDEALRWFNVASIWSAQDAIECRVHLPIFRMIDLVWGVGEQPSQPIPNGLFGSNGSILLNSPILSVRLRRIVSYRDSNQDAKRTALAWVLDWVEKNPSPSDATYLCAHGAGEEEDLSEYVKGAQGRVARQETVLARSRSQYENLLAEGAEQEPVRE